MFQIFFFKLETESNYILFLDNLNKFQDLNLKLYYFTAETNSCRGFLKQFKVFLVKLFATVVWFSNLKLL